MLIGLLLQQVLDRPNVVEYVAEPKPAEALNLVIENKIESLEDMATRIAGEYDIPTTTLFNLVESESKWNPKADNSYDRGLVQINRTAWPDITDEQAFDPEFSLRFAAEKIKNGEEYKWVACNCYALAEALTKFKLPRNIDIVPNELYPRVGSVAILRYSSAKHLAVITKVTEEGIWVREANYTPCKIGSRLIKFDDQHLKGFYTPSEGG